MKQTKLTQNRINLIKLYFELSGKDELKVEIDGNASVLDSETILVTPAGITRMYGTVNEDREWKWEECANDDIAFTIEGMDFDIKKFFGLSNSTYIGYYSDWHKAQ